MVSQIVRRQLAAVTAVAACLFAAACGTPSQSPSPGPAATEFSIRGSFPVAAGRSLFIDCRGEGSITVLLEVGFDAAAQIEADSPPQAPLTIMESLDQCEGHPTCLKVAEFIPGIAQALVAAAGRGGKYIQVNASHDLYRRA